MWKWTGGYFYTNNVQFENVSFFIKVSDEGKFLLFQNGEINGKSAMLSYWYAWCKNADSWQYQSKFGDWGMCNDNHLFISIHWEVKRIWLRKKISTQGDKWFKSFTIILSQSVWSIRFTATMEMGTFHLWSAIELSILDQFWQMRRQNHCDLISFFMLFSHLNND